MLPNVVIYGFYAKEHLLTQGFAGLRKPCAVKGVLSVFIGQPLPHHVHYAEG